jgi:transcription termination/antitermination protein NusG
MPGEVTGRSFAAIPRAYVESAPPAGQSKALLAPRSFSNMRSQEATQVLPEHRTPRWYVTHTRSRHEKAVAEQLRRKGIETFLPLYETIRRWKNGEHCVQLPLFPCYAFVRIALNDRLPVLKVPGVVRLVGFSGTPAPLADEEVNGLIRALTAGVKAEPHPYLTVGRRVRITAGPLAGHEGILVRRKGAVRVVLSIDLIQRSVLVDVTGDALEPA